MMTRIVAFLQNVRRSQSGSVAIQLGLSLVAIIGMVALGTEITFLYFKHRQLQMFADAAAFSAATAASRGYPNPTIEAQAVVGQLATDNIVAYAGDVTVIVNMPPTSGNYTSPADGAVEVIVSQPQTLTMVGLFRAGLFNVGARAVAKAGPLGSYCVFALDSTASGAVTISNNVVVQPPPCQNRCGVGTNSSSDTALILSNNAAINGSVSVVGNWSLSNNAALNCTPKTNHAPPMSDPYAGVPLQAPPGPCINPPAPCQNCTVHLLNPTGEAHYCRLNYSNNVIINVDPGAYYIDNQLSLQNNVTVNANGGVTLIINGNYAMSLGNNATLNLTAPTSGEYSGLAMASIRTATATVTQEFQNNTILNLKGAIYFPNQILKLDNNSTVNAPICGQEIARVIQIQNNALLSNNCPGTGVLPISGGQVSLVE